MNVNLPCKPKSQSTPKSAMKIIVKGFLKTILVLFILLVGLIYISGKAYLFKAAWYGTADIDDYKIFENRAIPAGEGQSWEISDNYNKVIYPVDLNKKLEETESIAMLLISNDSILFEKYWDGYSDSSLSGSFSVAKSIVSILTGIAIREGKIKSVDQPVSDFLPEFKKGLAAKLTIKHLLTMSSGSNWDESYSSPFSVTTEAYYGKDLYKTATGVKIEKEPGTFHEYSSGNTELLALVLEKVTGKTLSDYAAEKLWKPIKAEHSALWSLDKKDGHEKAYCCFNTNARDFARIGQLMLDSGRWKGTTLIDKDYWQASITPCGIQDEFGETCNYYGYQWWILPERQDIFYARGILGQFIVVIPNKKMIVVRLGKKSGGNRTPNSAELVYWLVDWAEKI
jgi:CubicO group peptidase (beta-lactamase class C family)